MGCISEIFFTTENLWDELPVSENNGIIECKAHDLDYSIAIDRRKL